jgi:type 1 glutamine amidotransferase
VSSTIRVLVVRSLVGAVAALLVPAWAASEAPRARPKPPAFRAVVLTETGGQHGAFVDAARIWLTSASARDGFAVDYIETTDRIDEAFLADYAVVIQLNYPPYAWTSRAKAAFEAYIEKGRGGWVGFHHATLLGEFDGYPLWSWFSEFMGQIRFADYIAGFAAGTVRVEDTAHPCMRGLPESFPVSREEWYTYDRSPRPNVHVLASVDEATYSPVSDKKMGDHPVVWTNDRLAARNVYIFMGHGPELFQSTPFTTLVRNAVLWAAGR